MNDLEKALSNIKNNIDGSGTMRVKGVELCKDDVLELYYNLGKKRKFSLKHETESKSKKECVLSIASNVLTQWQTITYYHSVAKTNFENELYLSFFNDLDLLVTNDFSTIGDFHETSALLQIPDLPYDYTEHINFYVDENGYYSQEIEDIIGFIRSKVDLGYYVVVEIDNYFVNPMPNGHRALRHLIYGYNDFNKQLYCRGFINKEFISYKLDYTKFATAYEYSKIVNVKAPVFLELYKRKSVIDLSAKKENDAAGLYTYYKSTNSYKVLQAEEKVNRWTNCTEYVGLNASEQFIWLLELMIEGKAELCYQCMHAFYENKLMLLERGKYFLGKSKIENLEKAVYYANLARYQFMKYVITKKKKDLQDCCMLCRKCVEMEKYYFQIHFG